MNSVNMKQGIILKGLTNLSKRDKEDHTHEEEFIKKMCIRDSSYTTAVLSLVSPASSSSEEATPSSEMVPRHPVPAAF